MSQRRFRMEHAIFRSVEDCHDIHLDGAGPPAWRSLLLASPSGGGSLVAACTPRGGTSAPQPDDFSHDCNIFRTIVPDGTSPMQYLPPHTRVVGYPIDLRPYRSGAFVWTRTIGLVQEESACAFFCWSTAVYDGDGSRSVDAESLTKR
jgi:hypothetical protein